MKKYTSISEIKAETVKRVSSGHDELDWLYGLSKDKNLYQWGIPIRTISTWVGEGGVGKSRLAINLAKYKAIHDKKVLYLQNEVDLATLASWVGDTTKMQNFFCSDVTALSEQVAIIKKLKPDFVFVDSINLIDEFGSGTAKSIKTIIDGFRDAIKGSETHVVILCQLNKEGSATGSTALGHLPDINLSLTNTAEDGVFAVSIGKKHRYGRKGTAYTSLWRHIETGVECISKNRLADDRWLQSDGYKIDYFTNTESVDFDSTPEIGGIPDIGPCDPNFDYSAPRSVIDMNGGIPDTGDGGIPDIGPGPTLVNNNSYSHVKIEDYSPAVQEAYHDITNQKRSKSYKGPKKPNRFIQFVKKNWGF